MTFWQFVVAHKAELWASAASVLFVFSEYLAQNPNTQANGVFQWLQGFLKKESGKP